MNQTFATIRPYLQLIAQLFQGIAAGRRRGAYLVIGNSTAETNEHGASPAM